MMDKKCRMCHLGHGTGGVVIIVLGFIWLFSAMRLITWDVVSVLLAALVILIGVKKLAMSNYCMSGKCDCDDCDKK